MPSKLTLKDKELLYAKASDFLLLSLCLLELSLLEL